jgi:hypothetical protein
LYLPPDTGFSVGWLKVRSGTSTQPVNQAATRKFTFVFESNVRASAPGAPCTMTMKVLELHSR